MSRDENSNQQTDKTFKQRLVGAIVLVSLAVIFLPMIFDKQEDYRSTTVLVEVPPRPQVALPEEQVVEEVTIARKQPVEIAVPETRPEPAPQPTPESVPAAKPAPSAAAKAKAEPPARGPAVGIDANNLPVSWSVQVASGGDHKAALKVRDSYREQGYKAYVRTEKNLHKVQLGPYIKVADAKQACNRIKQQKNNQNACFVLRFEPVN